MKRSLSFYKIVYHGVAVLACLLILTSSAYAVPAHRMQEYYDIQIPEDDYVLFYARRMVSGRYVALDFNKKEARVYGPSQEDGLLFSRQITDAELDQAIAILTSDQVKKIPESNYKGALDAFEFSAYGIIQGVKLKFHHILPDDPAVLELHDLYKHFLVNH